MCELQAAARDVKEVVPRDQAGRCAGRCHLKAGTLILEALGLARHSSSNVEKVEGAVEMWRRVEVDARCMRALSYA